MPFLERAAELNPPTRSHRRLFDFQVTHVGYGETWKEKAVVKAYSMKRSYPNYPTPCATLKGFTSLDNSTSLIWATKTRYGHTLRSAKISDGWRHMQILICTSKQMFASVSAATLAIATENCSSLEFRRSLLANTMTRRNFECLIDVSHFLHTKCYKKGKLL